MNTAALEQAVHSVGLFLLLAVPGCLFSRKKWITREQVGGLSTVMMNYIWPIMVLDAMARTERTPALLGGMGRMVLYTVLSVLMAAALAWLWLRLAKIPRAPGLILLFGLMFSNTGLLGIPMMNSLFAGQAQLGEAMAYTTAVELVSNVGLFTVGTAVMQLGCGRPGRLGWRGLLSPGMAGVLLGLVLLLTGAELPALASDFLSTAGAASTPLIMFIIGAQLGELRLGEALRDRRIYVFCALKLLLIPAASCLAIRLGIGDGGLTGLVSVLLTAMPAPSCTALFSRQYGGDYSLATRCVLVSTLLSAVTIPLWIALIWR